MNGDLQRGTSPDHMSGRDSRLRAAASWVAFSAAMLSMPVLMVGAKAPTISTEAAVSSDQGQYFPETGHTLDTVFEAFYYSLGGAAVVGHPITEAFVDPYSEFLIQYFENARFEIAPNSVGELEVRLTDLGVLLGGWDLTLEVGKFPFGNNPGCRYYAESGHQVCHAFLDYYDAQSGPAVFGFPVTEFRFEAGRMVQYFQAFRLDWYPESDQGQRIRVAPLGREHFRLMGYEPALLEPVVPGDLEDYPVLDIRLSASVLKPLIGAGETQQVYLVVSDQNRQPVTGAAALLTIYRSDGIRFRMMPVTDAAGVTRIDLPLGDTVPGSRVALEYTVVYGNLSAITRDSFYIWY